ncbi:MAG: quinolinate synthase NadA [bacterium]
MNSVITKINDLKKKRNAVILAHNYTIPDVQDIADFTGDSLELSRRAANVKEDVIVFCGVKFMAETAKILSPQKTVLMPDKESGCPMADMISAEDVRKLKKEHPGSVVVCYVNSNADVKAESDIACTSANAVRVVDSIPQQTDVIFIPDRYLGKFVENNLNRKLILWNGYCPTHMKITPGKIKRARELFPDAKVLVHPECAPDTIKAADMALSTGQMKKYISGAPAGRYLIGTEIGMIYPLSKFGSGREIIRISDDITCPNMKLNNLEKIIWSLEDNKYEIKLDAEIINRAKACIEKMIKI